MVYNKSSVVLSASSTKCQRLGRERGCRHMNCKEVEKMIPAFLQDDLDSKELQQFIGHIESCPECREELSIQFLVSEGLERLEAGNHFNLQKALTWKLEDARHQVMVRRILQDTLLCLEVAVGAAILIALLIVFRF